MAIFKFSVNLRICAFSRMAVCCIHFPLPFRCTLFVKLQECLSVLAIILRDFQTKEGLFKRIDLPDETVGAISQLRGVKTHRSRWTNLHPKRLSNVNGAWLSCSVCCEVIVAVIILSIRWKIAILCNELTSINRARELVGQDMPTASLLRSIL